MIKQSEIHWHLNDKCDIECSYCPGKYRAGTNQKSIEDYLTIVQKLQDSRYKNSESIHWKLGGGEPIQFPGLTSLLKKIKSKPSYIRLDTSGGNSWFDLIETKDYVDHYQLTHHFWQNESVLNFIIDFCQTDNKKLSVIIPLTPGRIFEDRDKIEQLKSQGINASEQILYNEGGSYWDGYSKVDINRILGRPDDYVTVQQPVESTYVDLSKAPMDDSPSYTGMGCYAGVDYIYISHKGFASGSECGGRDMGNVFHTDWVAPYGPFTCPINYCRSSNDRNKIRNGIL